MNLKETVDKIKEQKNVTLEQLQYILTCEEEIDYLYETARSVADSIYGKQIFKRGLIEFTNYCKNDCYYCGIRRSNLEANRYRLDKETILACCENGYRLGYRTFVLQGGEDGYYSDERIVDIVQAIHTSYPDCAITLSIGEKDKESYRRYFEAGATRYLLRHETADSKHYAMLHPQELSHDHRIRCLYHLKEIGFQVGCGFMIGSPYQTTEHLYQELQWIRKFQPHMVGIGPFIPQQQTPFAKESAGTLQQTLCLLALIRLIHPHVLLPATTALGTIQENGRLLGILAGANVVMPNLSPVEVREKYALYEKKACTGTEAIEGDSILKESIQSIGYTLVCDRGDYR